MNKIQKIVFPVDFSRRSKQAAPHVRTWARRFDAEIVAVYFIDPEDNAASPPSDELFVPENLPVLEDRATRDLDFFCDQNLPACNVRRIVKIGEKANGISVVAQDEKADLIMIPRDHQMFVERLVRDSVTAKILNDCPVPVWTSEHLDEDLSPEIAQILCAIHMGEDVSLDAANERLIASVRLVATMFGAKVTCLYVGEQSGGACHCDSPVAAAIAERLEKIRHEMIGMAHCEVGSGCIARAIHRVAVEKSANLIMTGRSRPGTISLGVQNHILAIDHNGPCPVLSVL